MPHLTNKRITRHCQVVLLCILALGLWRSSGQDLSHRRDPTPIIYPGQVNIGLVANIHEAPAANSSSGCGKLRQDAVQKVMASVWAAHRVNFVKEDSQELNIGIYIYDTCGREDVAQRQIYRLLGHVGHVQTTTCSEKRIPPLFAVITEGDDSTLRTPLQLLEAFGVPVVSTSSPPPVADQTRNPEIYLSTAPTPAAVARAAVTVLRQLRLLEVAVIAEDKPPSTLFGEFSREAHISGMQALPVDHPSIVGDPDNFLASLQVVSEYGKSRLKAVVFLVSMEQALDLLQSVDSSNFPQMPWVIVTEKDPTPTILATFKRTQLRSLQKVLILSPETSNIPEFQEYFKQLLQEDTIKYHPLLVEFAEAVSGIYKQQDSYNINPWRRISASIQRRDIGSDSTRNSSDESISKEFDNSTEDKTNFDITKAYKESDVSSIVKAVWALAGSLKAVQKRSCRRGTDCLLYLRRSLSSYVLKAARNLKYSLDESSGSLSLQGSNLTFSEDGILTSVRYSLKGFTHRGDIQEIGWYSDETGLAVDHDVILPFNGFVFKNIDPPATTTASPIPEFLSKYRFLSDKLPSVSKTTTVPSAVPPSTTKMATIAKDFEINSTISNIMVSQPQGMSSSVNADLSTSPIDDAEYTSWRILEDISLNQRPLTTTITSLTNEEPMSASELSHYNDDTLFRLPENISANENNVFEELGVSLPKLDINLNYSAKPKGREADYNLGPAYGVESELSSNLRSVSLTSHNEPRTNDAFRQRESDFEQTSLFAASGPALARSVERTSEGFVPPMATEDVKVVSSSRNLRIAAWLARPWALTILGLCGFGILVTMYVLVFLMVKSCEGSLKKTNTSVAVAQLMSLIFLYVAAGLYTWKPSSLLCGLQRLIPNISYSFCFGCLILKGMHLRAQNSLGLGGSVNKCNQVLTLLFIVGVQVALEIQWWFVRPPVITSSLECVTTKEEIMESQGYISFLLLLGVVLAISTRKIPYNCQEVRSLIGTTLTCLVVFLAWDIACWLLPDTASRNIAAPSALLVTAVVVLIGIFGPQLFAIHKYGGFPHKPLSYADSLSTVFTMFKDLDNGSNSGSTGRGKKTAKTLETPFSNDGNEGTRNPLYNDYQSAYP